MKPLKRTALWLLILAEIPSAVPLLSTAEARLENPQGRAEGTPEFRYETEAAALSRSTAVQGFLCQVQQDLAAGRFAAALSNVGRALALKPGDPEILASRKRLRIVAGLYPEVRNFASNLAQAALYEGIMEFLERRNASALKKIEYAQGFKPEDGKLESLMKAIEAGTGVRRTGSASAPRKEAGSPEKDIAGLMALMEGALREREYDKVLKLAAQVMRLDPSNSLAYKRMGAAYYGLKKYPEALKALRSAYRLEMDEQAKKSLRSYIDALSSLMEREGPPPASPFSPKTPQELERLYEAGVELYAQGRLSEAAGMFRRILESEPDHGLARKALQRIEAERAQEGAKR